MGHGRGKPAARPVPGSHAVLLQSMADEFARRDPDGSKAAQIDDPEAAARQAADTLLETAALWQQHLGGFYDVEGVRGLLSRAGRPVSRQAVSKREGLLGLRTGSGRVVYPAFQFHGSRPVEGLAAVLRELPEAVVSRWTVASWLVSPQPDLDGQRPIDVLADGYLEPVLGAARGWASALAA